MCGEKPSKHPCFIARYGSPPRVRGKVFGQDLSLLGLRITPACAGKSVQPAAEARGEGDHPRVCGEKHQLHFRPSDQPGSPPRVRGKVYGITCYTPSIGITPACAGKSSATVRGGDSVRDHPRVCGEKAVAWLSPLPFAGSPPRVRGKVSVVAQYRGYSGITPACAGKSQLKLTRTGTG